jgi:hypothetical protein
LRYGRARVASAHGLREAEGCHAGANPGTQRGGHASFTPAIPRKHHAYMRSPAWRRLFLPGVLGAVGLLGVVLVVRPPIGRIAGSPVVSVVSKAEHSESSQNSALPVMALKPPNPAAQKPGPPDPAAQESAAESADRAAEAAARLAASSVSN